MRIRKHAKVSPLVYAASSLKPGTTLLKLNQCELNQSPWDVIVFSSSSNSSQVDGDDSFFGNGSFDESIGTLESVASMKSSWDDADVNAEKWVCSDGVAAAEDGENGGGNDVEMEEEEEQVGLICCNIDEKGWKCKKKAKKEQALCDNHLSSQVRKADKGSESSEPHRRRPRVKKPSSSSDPNDYYYYSGFGPRWGKRRGGSGGAGGGGGSNVVTNDEANNVDHLEAIREPRPSSTSQFDNEEFDYDEADEEEEGGKKRARKPIKARSLKSLM